MGDFGGRADTGGIFGGGSRAPSMAVLPRADSVAGGGSRYGGGGNAGGLVRPGTASLGPVPRRPPSIMPVIRPRTAAGAQAAGARPLPPPGKISAHSFRVEKRSQYQGEMNVPSILFIGKAGEPSNPSVAKQMKAELSKYKLRPGALEELGIEHPGDDDSDEEGVEPRAGGTASPNRKPVAFDMGPYGGKREMDSLRRQIVETETAALESRVQSQGIVTKTQTIVKNVEEKVGHVRESNQQLDSELVEIERQIEELKRISRSQIDEIKALRETNKLKEARLSTEAQELQRTEGAIRDAMLTAQESKAAPALRGATGGAPGTPGKAQVASQGAGGGGGAGGQMVVSIGSAAPSAAVSSFTRSASMGGGGNQGAAAGMAQGSMKNMMAQGSMKNPGGAGFGGVVGDLSGGEVGYVGDKGEKAADQPELESLLHLCDDIDITDGRIWSQAGSRAQEEQEYLASYPTEDFVDVPPWLSVNKPPTDWSELKGSDKMGYKPAQLAAPLVTFEIEHVYGYSGCASVDNLHCAGSGKLIYPAACLCVVHDIAHGHQRFFDGHADAVLCLTLHPEGKLVASGDVGKSSKVLVWDVDNPNEPALVALWGVHQAGVGCLSFSRDGNRLVTVGRDVDHSMCVWDWRKAEQLAVSKTGPSPVIAVRFDPVSSVVITAGVRHLKFWTMEGTRLQQDFANFNKKGSLQGILSIAFMMVRDKDGVTACATVTGTQDGCLYLWNDRFQLFHYEKKAHDGPVNIIVAPHKGDADVGDFALTGGADGKIRRWDAHQNIGLTPIWTVDLEERTRAVKSPFSSKRFPVRGVSVSDNVIYIGTCMNEIYQFVLEPTPPGKVARAPECSQVVMQAHAQGNVYAMDMHPLKHEFATVAWDATLRVWDAQARTCARAVQMLPLDADERVAASAVQYSPDGAHLAVAFQNGEVWIFDTDAMSAAPEMTADSEKLLARSDDDEPIKLPKDKYSALAKKATPVSVLRYRPDGVLLAVAGLGGKVTIYEVERDYTELTVLPAHTCNIRSIDFSEDCKLMQTSDVDNRIHYTKFETEDGEINPVLVGVASDPNGFSNVAWATWTSALGWPVEGIYDVNRHDQHSRMSAYGSREHSLLLAWEDKDVLLYNLPCRHGAAARRFKGHSSVPAQVRFLHDACGMVSVGTKDMCVIQWKPQDVAARVEQKEDEEIRVLVDRASHVRVEGVVVRMAFDEKADIAVSSKAADSKWKQLRDGLAELLQVANDRHAVGPERFELVRMMMGSLVFDVCFLPNALGWSVEPTAETLLKRLRKVFETGAFTKKFPKVGEGFEVLQENPEPDDDFLPQKPWLNVITSPSDWTEERGSALLNYAPSHILQQLDEVDADDIAKLQKEARLPSIVAFEGQEFNAVDPAHIDAEDAEGEGRRLIALDRVHGYNGWAGGGNLNYLDGEHLVYPAGCIGVLHDISVNRQSFMLGHRDQISAMAKQPTEAGAMVSLFATGELGQRGAIKVWSTGGGSQSPKLFACLQGLHNGNVAALCFIGEDKVVSAGCDAEHQLAVWDVKEQKLWGSGRGDANAIFALDSPGKGQEEGEEGTQDYETFVSVGVRHIKFWRLDEEKKQIVPRGGIFGNKGHVQTMLCVKTFYETPDTEEPQLVSITGTEDGSVYVWKDRMLSQNMRKAHRGPVFALCITESCVRWADGKLSLTDGMQSHLVLTGGKDGVIRICKYDMSQGLSALFALDTTQLDARVKPRLMAARNSIRSLASSMAGQGWLRLAFGTGANDVVQLELDVRNEKNIKVLQHTLSSVVHGHSCSELAGLCTHPDVPEFATVGEDATLRLWNATTYQQVACLNLGISGSAVDYNCADYKVECREHVAVGFSTGGVVVLDTDAVRRGLDYEGCFVTRLAERKRRITGVKYSPDGNWLAAASLDYVIDIYMVDRKYSRWGVCRGHRDVIHHMDWAADSLTLRSNDSSQELLHWQVDTMLKGQIAATASAHQLNDVMWFSSTCHLTWATHGICEAYAFESEIAAVDRSRNGALLAAVDDYGSIRLLRFPCLKGAKSQRFPAHVGPVANVRFTYDDSSLISISSSDMCILQWRVALVPTGEHRQVADLLVGQMALTTTSAAALGHDNDSDDLEMFKPFHASVFAPKQWQPEEDMYQAPNQELELETVHGCRGHDRHAHACFNVLFHAVYYTAKVVVVQDRECGLQRFFLGHTEDVSCIASHPQGRLCASGQMGASALICVWNSTKQEPRSVQGRRQRSLKQLAAFEAKNANGIVAMSFSSSGDLLVTVSKNLHHVVTLWDWKQGAALSEVKGSMKRTLAIACQRWGAADCFVTCGVKHVKFWKVVDGKLKGKIADLSSRGVLSTQLSCTWSKQHAITGNDHGFLYIWKDARLVTTVPGHAGPVFALHTARQLSAAGDSVFCSACGNGVVKMWTIHKRDVIARDEAVRYKRMAAEAQTPEESRQFAEAAHKHDMEAQSALEGGTSDVEVHCFENEGTHIRKVIDLLNVPSNGKDVSVRSAFLQFDAAVKTVSSNGVWRVLVGTSRNELYQLTLEQLISAPNDETTEQHRGMLERETVKVYKSVNYGQDGIGGPNLPAIQLLVQAHAPIASDASLEQPMLSPNLEMCSLRALAVHPSDENEYATCGPDGVLRIWDVEHGRVRFLHRLDQDLQAQHVVQSLCYSPDCENVYHLAIGCNGAILIMDASEQLSSGSGITAMAILDKAMHVSPREVVTSLKYSATCNSEKMCFLAAGMSSGSIVLYSTPIVDDTDMFRRDMSWICKFKGHTGSVLHMDFSKQDGGDAEFLQSNCSRFELRFWNLKAMKEHKSASERRDEMWETLNCSLSWPALGIMPGEYAVVPSVDRSPDNSNMVHAIWPDKVPVLAVSGSSGEVMLTRYPCLERALTKRWTAHSSAPSAIRFTNGAQSVISIGEEDLSVFHWRRQLPVLMDTERILEVPAPMKANAGQTHAQFMAKQHGSHDSAAGGQLGAQAAFDDAKPFLATTKLLKDFGWDDFHPKDLLSAGRNDLTKYRLKLHHVHGGRGPCSLNHVHYNQEGRALYSVASVVVVQEADTQVHHFDGHTDDVLCLEVSEDGLLAATGQVSSTGKSRILIWAALTARVEVEVEVAREGGIALLSFKPNRVGGKPEFLASIANDEDGSLDIWDMRDYIAGKKVVPLLTCMAGDKHRILAVGWNPFHKDAFGSLVTCGDKHLHFWTFAEDTSEEGDVEASGANAVHLKRHQPLWYDTTKQTAFCLCFMEKTKADSASKPSPHGYTLTGMQDSTVFFWKWNEDDSGVAVLKVLQTQHEGPIFSLRMLGGFVLSGGHDGFLKLWRSDSFGEGRPVHKPIDMSKIGAGSGAAGTYASSMITPSIRSLCARLHSVKDDGDVLSVLVGTASNEIYELTITGKDEVQVQSRPVVQGHGGRQLQGLAMHPVKDWFGTVGDDGVVRVWDLAKRECTFAALLKDGQGHMVAGNALCFRGKVDRPITTQQCPVCKYGTLEQENTFHCDELAVGTVSGDVVIFKMGENGELVECARKHYRDKAITCLQYSPGGVYLAAAAEVVIDVLLPDEDHRRVGVCMGHLSPICSIDWTEEGDFMQTSDSALELMFWSMTTREEKKPLPEFVAYSKPILLNKRKWATMTSTLGWTWHCIYSPGSEAVGLNAVDRFILSRRDSKKALGVSGDATGLIKLFPYPMQQCERQPAPVAQDFKLHSAGVTKVRFSASGQYIVSLGGLDCSIMQWEVQAPNRDPSAAAEEEDGADPVNAEDADTDDDDELDQLRSGEP